MTGVITVETGRDAASGPRGRPAAGDGRAPGRVSWFRPLVCACAAVAAAVRVVVYLGYYRGRPLGWRALDLFGLDYQVEEDVRDGRPRQGSWAGIVAFWILAPLAAAGFARVRGVARWLLLAPVLTVAITTVVFYGGHRVRSPLEPVIVLAAAPAAVALARHLRERFRGERPVAAPEPDVAGALTS